MIHLTEDRRIVFRHANGDIYTVSRNGGTKHPGYLYLPEGEANSDENIHSTEDLTELARMALNKECAVRCKNIYTSTQEYLHFREASFAATKSSPRSQAPWVFRKLGMSEVKCPNQN